MIVIRCYSVMGHSTFEASCVHSADPLGSHLIWRTAGREPAVGLLSVLEDIDDAMRAMLRALEHGDVELSDDCLEA